LSDQAETKVTDEELREFAQEVVADAVDQMRPDERMRLAQTAGQCRAAGLDGAEMLRSALDELSSIGDEYSSARYRKASYQAYTGAVILLGS